MEVAPDDDRTAEVVGNAFVELHALRARSRATQHRLAAGATLGAETSIDKVLVATAEQATYDAVRRLLPGVVELDDGAAGEAWRTEYLYSRAATIYGGTPRCSATSSPAASSTSGATSDRRRRARHLHESARVALAAADGRDAATTRARAARLARDARGRAATTRSTSCSGRSARRTPPRRRSTT